MARLLSVLLAVMGCVPFGAAIAEGNCPAGMYPIGGQGVSGCAPIPTSKAPAAANPEIIWVSRWGAVAVDREAVGLSTDFPDEQGATTAALNRCVERGGSKCKVLTTYRNTCIAAAVSMRDGKYVPGRFAMQTGPDVQAIQASAVELCSKDNGTDCEVAYTNCSLP